MHEYLSTALTLTSQMKANFVAAFFSILFASVCIYICWWYWRLNRAYAKFPSVRSEIKMLKKVMLGRFPKKGTVTGVMFLEFRQVAKRFQKEGFFVLWFFRPFLFVYNKDLWKKLYTDPAIVNKSITYNLIKDTFGDGLVTSKEEMWKKDRKLLNPVFTLGALKRKLCIFNDVASKLVTELEKRIDKPTSDVDDILRQYTFDVMAQSLLGKKLHDENYKEKLVKYFNAVHDVSQGMVYRFVHPWLYWSTALPLFSAGRKYLRAREYMQQFTLEVLSKLKTSISAESADDVDSTDECKTSFTRILLEQHLRDPTFTMQHVQDHVTTMMAAAYDTTSYTLLWNLYLLGLHPEVQEKAFKEIEAIAVADVTYEEICELKYLECIIKETLRLYPTLPTFGRKLNKDIQWEDYTIPQGTDICFFLFMLHRCPDTFPDPDKFDPERFSSNSEILNCAYMPFAEGYRSCIGKRFAMIELKVMLAHIIRHFKIETLEEIEPSDVDWVIMLAPVKRFQFLFTLR